MLTRVLGEELKPHRISVDELIPGPVKTYQSSQRSQNPNDSLFDPNNEWIKEPEDVIPLASWPLNLHKALHLRHSV